MRTTARIAATAACAVALVGCGEDEQAVPSGAGGAETAITVTVLPEGPGGPVRREEVACPGHELCDRLARVPLDAFDPVPDDVACTQIFGGPATATVRGTVRGEPVDARFARTDGCEIARWDRLSWLLGDVPGPGPPP